MMSPLYYCQLENSRMVSHFFSGDGWVPSSAKFPSQWAWGLYSADPIVALWKGCMTGEVSMLSVLLSPKKQITMADSKSQNLTRAACSWNSLWEVSMLSVLCGHLKTITMVRLKSELDTVLLKFILITTSADDKPGYFPVLVWYIGLHLVLTLVSRTLHQASMIWVNTSTVPVLAQ
jgi:hypothetical protein